MFSQTSHHHGTRNHLLDHEIDDKKISIDAKAVMTGMKKFKLAKGYKINKTNTSVKMQQQERMKF